MKTSMTIPARAGRLDEEVVRGREVAQEVAVELGLAVLVEPEGGVELADGLLRHERLEERDERRRVLGVHVEVRAREAEDDRGLVLVAEDGVDARRGPCGSGARRRRGAAGRPCATRPTRYAPLLRKKTGRRRSSASKAGAPQACGEDALERARRERRVAREILPARGERERRERAPRRPPRGRAARRRTRGSGPRPRPGAASARGGTNSARSSTPTVWKMRREAELKNVSSELDVRAAPATSAAKRAFISVQTAGPRRRRRKSGRGPRARGRASSCRARGARARRRARSASRAPRSARARGA